MKIISDTLRKFAMTEIDPRHVEAWMRLQHPILGSLDRAAFNAAVITAAYAVERAGPAESEALATALGVI